MRIGEAPNQLNKKIKYNQKSAIYQGYQINFYKRQVCK